MRTFSDWVYHRTFTVDWYAWDLGSFYCALTMSDGTVLHLDDRLVGLCISDEDGYEPLSEILGLTAYETILWDAETTPFAAAVEQLCLDKLPKTVDLPYEWKGVYTHESALEPAIVNNYGSNNWSTSIELTNRSGGKIVGWISGQADRFHDTGGCCIIDSKVSHACPRCGTFVPHTLGTDVVKASRYSPDWVGFEFSLGSFE